MRRGLKICYIFSSRRPEYRLVNNINQEFLNINGAAVREHYLSIKTTRYLLFSSLASFLAAAMSEAVMEPWVRPSLLLLRSFFLRLGSLAEGEPPFRDIRGEDSVELLWEAPAGLSVVRLERGGRPPTTLRLFLFSAPED